ncbi:MAG: zf-HC2 domain-containing protein [Acidobacteriota bacterium]|nr:zf-HC2 domain-containing protein [Acidobacteriota bacterium]
MNCAKWEEWAALAAGGDLPEAEARGLAEHVAGCAACREFADGLVLSQAALRDLRADAPDAAEYARLREGVMRRVSASRVPKWWLGAVAAGLLLMTAAGYWEIGRDRSLTVAARNLVNRTPLVPPLPLPISEPRPSGSARRRRHRPIAPPLVVKLATDDPEVTIIWLIDQKGDGE